MTSRDAVEFNMTMERQWIGDIGLAVLLALPTAALSRPHIPPLKETRAAAPLAQLAALAERSPVERRFSLPG
jgi:hypothetical protein